MDNIIEQVEIIKRDLKDSLNKIVINQNWINGWTKKHGIADRKITHEII